MENRLGAVESRFADIVWENEPLTSRQLVELCEKELNWKRTTTYTVLKKFCERGIFKNENRMVSAIISREEFYSMQSQEIVKESFKGSLPAFIAAFTKKQKLSKNEIDQIRDMIDSYQED